MSIVLDPPASPQAETQDKQRRQWDSPTLLLLAAAGCLFLLLALPILRQWFTSYVQSDSDYAYGPLVPCLVALMLWHKRETLRTVTLRPCYPALCVLAPALALMVFASKEQFAALSSVGLLAAAWSAAWLVLGTRWVRAAIFPLAFLLWMAPLPGPIIHDSTYSLQQLCTVLANHALNLLTFPTSLSGNVITMRTFVLFVDVPCSGMKLLLTMLMFGSAFAWLTDGSPRLRMGLFLFTLPLSIADNTLRITILGILGECFGASTEHLFHDTSGLLTVAFGLVILFSTARRIGCRTFAGWPLF